MNARERFLATMHFEKIDRPLFWEFGYWSQTIQRWASEGLPVDGRLSQIESYYGDLTRSNTVGGELSALEEDVGIRTEWGGDSFHIARPIDIFVRQYFGFDKGLKTVPLNSWLCPPFEVEVLKEDSDSMILRDEWGNTKKIWKNRSSTPHFLDWSVKNRYDFDKIKEERLGLQLDNRLPANWKELIKEYHTLDHPLAIGGYPCGFFGSLRFLMGEMNLFTGYYDNADFIKYMLHCLTDFWISLWSHVLADVKVDCALFWEDMAYNKGSLISPKVFKEFMTPCYQKIIGFLKDKGVDIAIVDTDGDCRELIPLFMETGVTGLLPFEVQAGMDIVELRKQYPTLQIMGGLNKRDLTKGKEMIDEELEKKLPYMLKHGGYIPTADHFIPPDVPWEHFKYYRMRIEEISSP